MRSVVRAYVGTSGFSHDGFRGVFYPVGLPAKDMLGFYATHLPAVELNATFYRVPAAKTVANWREQVPEAFRFALKAPQRITHRARLSGADDTVAFFYRSAAELGEKLGPVLFQLPPSFQKDLPRLEAFLELLPAGGHAAFEFRHASWFSDDVFDLLRRKRVALCVAESEALEAPVVATANFGYLRLRKVDYGSSQLAAWSERILEQAWDDVFAFFKHEEGARGVAHAQTLAALLEARR